MRYTQQNWKIDTDNCRRKTFKYFKKYEINIKNYKRFFMHANDLLNKLAL